MDIHITPSPQDKSQENQNPVASTTQLVQLAHGGAPVLSKQSSELIHDSQSPSENIEQRQKLTLPTVVADCNNFKKVTSEVMIPQVGLC